MGAALRRPRRNCLTRLWALPGPAPVGLATLAEYGFALAGGWAVQTHGNLGGPSEGVDRFPTLAAAASHACSPGSGDTSRSLGHACEGDDLKRLPDVPPDRRDGQVARPAAEKPR
jgi:hypothetical protein